MSPPYRPTYKMVVQDASGNETPVGYFERLDEASAFARTSELVEDKNVLLYKYVKAEDTYKPYDKWSY
ncbi:MAG: hypothetical protein IJ719_19385 [Clostridia bacterium]|nr:hypothetical protein [Clostridia bacterium]